MIMIAELKDDTRSFLGIAKVIRKVESHDGKT